MNGTGYVIFGMLALGARTGYEIKNVVDHSTRFFWAASYGQIYPELRRLEAAGLVEGKSSPTGGRKRREFTLTKTGRAELVRGVGLCVSDAGAPRREPAQAVLRGCAPGRASTRAVAAAAAGPRAVPRNPPRDRGSAGDDPPFVDLVLRYGIAYGEFNVAWCAEQEARLRGNSREAA